MVLSVILSVTFFSYGCTISQRAALMDEAKAYALEEIQKAVPKIQAAIEAKLAEVKVKKMLELDAQLAQLKVVDPETGEADPASVKTWKSFDANNDNDLNEIELAKAGAWVTKELAMRVATGKMGKEQAGNIGKGVAATLATLLLIGLGKRGATGLAAKFGAPVAPGNPPTVPPAAPAAPQPLASAPPPGAPGG
jgi:hypothetical protein